MITIFKNKGIHFKFNNGYIMSIQIGPGNYCDNYDTNFWDYYEDKSHPTNLSSTNAEIAIIDKDGNWVTGDLVEESDDMVKGYVDLDEIIDIMLKVRQQ